MKSLWLSAVVPCLLVLQPSDAFATDTAASRSPQNSQERQVTLLESGWLFSFGGDSLKDAGDKGWKPVKVPHTWNSVGVYDTGVVPGGASDATVNKAQGVGWYKLALQSPTLAGGQRAWLEFDAASRVAEVWLNGVRLGSHAGGFSTFRFDATVALKPGPDNLLIVKVDNTPPAAGAAVPPTLPLMGDFFVHGGLYRPVRLIVTNPVHFDMLDHGGPGVYAATRSVTQGSASLVVKALMRNDSRRAMHGRWVIRLVDRDGNDAARGETAVRLGAGAGAESKIELTLANARLWQGTSDPYLYKLVAELQDNMGRVLDTVTQNFGVRTIALDPERGFLLNDKSMRLHGVGLHQDLASKGWAMSDEDISGMVNTIREMGANTIRLTHYQHGQAVHDLADRIGLILWDEIPLVSAWTIAADQTEAPPELAANARQQLVEMIRQNYNHAAVAVWGIANEVDFGPHRPDFISEAPEQTPDPRTLLTELNGVAKREDTLRPTVLANCCEDTHMDGVPDVSGITDGLAVNRYMGWYYGTADDLSRHLDALHAKHRGQPLAVSEYGAGGAISIHSDDPLGGRINPGGRQQPEEYQAWLHEQIWPVLRSKGYLWATWLWNSFDFSTNARKEGDSRDINTKGLVTYDGKIRKDAWWYYKANWSDAPTVHVAGRHYRDRAYAVTDVKVYSNAPATELFVNGRSLGAKRDCGFATCEWPSVRLVEGENRIEAKGAFGGEPVGDAILWTLADGAANTFRIDSGAIVAAQGSDRRFGSDTFFEGGSPQTMDKRKGLRGPPLPAKIAGTGDRDLVATFREGDFAYRVPVQPGRYIVTLTFAEPEAAKGERVFDVLANGKVVLPAFDIARAAGAPLKAATRSFAVSTPKGPLEIQFRSKIGKPIVSVIEVEPIRKSRKRP